MWANAQLDSRPSGAVPVAIDSENPPLESIIKYRVVKAKFNYAIWSQTSPKLVADLQRAGIWPII